MVGIGPAAGVELMRAWFGGRAYARHRHDTYAIGVTDSGVQTFDYRGATCASTAGRVIVLHPDEPHDGRAGSPEGFGYRMIYVEPSRIAAAARSIRGRAVPLPFLREAVSSNTMLRRAVDAAFAGFPAAPEPLAVDAVTLRLAEGLLTGGAPADAPARIDFGAVCRARDFLDAESARVVRSDELEAVSGQSRFSLARQFRAAIGTSPYRYLLMRRLDRARRGLREGMAAADLAAALGFADQAHLSRLFKAAYGITPGRYARLAAPR